MARVKYDEKARWSLKLHYAQFTALGALVDEMEFVKDGVCPIIFGGYLLTAGFAVDNTRVNDGGYYGVLYRYAIDYHEWDDTAPIELVDISADLFEDAGHALQWAMQIAEQNT